MVYPAKPVLLESVQTLMLTLDRALWIDEMHIFSRYMPSYLFVPYQIRTAKLSSFLLGVGRSIPAKNGRKYFTGQVIVL